MSTDARLMGLHWGLKPSFLQYVARTPDGQMSVSDGATASEGNIFVFEPDPDGSDVEAGRWAFRGDVRFAAHLGMLFVRVADPVVTLRDGRAEVSVLAPKGHADGDRIILTTCTLLPQHTDEDLRIWFASDVTLAPAGVPVFNDVYRAGEEFAPLAVFLPPE